MGVAASTTHLHEMAELLAHKPLNSHKEGMKRLHLQSAGGAGQVCLS